MSGGDIMAGWNDALAAGELRFPRCEECGAWNWYPLPRCRACQSPAMHWTPVEPLGRLYSWTRIHRAFARRAVAPLPYVTGIVDIDRAPGVRLVCLQAHDGEACRIGAAVKLSLQGGVDQPRWTFTQMSAP